MAKPHMCAPADLEKDLSNQVVIVTGANSGIGLVTAEQLAKQGAAVVLACRRLAQAEEAITDIRSRHPGAKVKALHLDLGSLESVRTFVGEFLATHDRLDVLVNNAGVMNTGEGRTQDGFEIQLGVNHLGHFLLTELLLDILEKSAPSRIVCLSSCYHDQAMGGKEGYIDFDDLHFDNRDYDGWTAYAQAKLANLLHAKHLAKELQGTGVVPVSVHPGWVRTNLAQNTMPVWVQDYVARPVLKLMGMIEPWEGAQTTLHTVLADEVEPGAYYSQLGIYRDKAANAGGWPMRSPNPHAHDDEAAARLYAVSKELVGLA
jgi:NAD(P)-dependent dehydrogenase (short-subunit alcohol dehydrogenase family)